MQTYTTLTLHDFNGDRDDRPVDNRRQRDSFANLREIPVLGNVVEPHLVTFIEIKAEQRVIIFIRPPDHVSSLNHESI